MTRNEFQALTKERIIYLDGATGSNLVKAGMPSGVCPEKWILEHKDVFLDLQKAYVNAGSVPGEVLNQFSMDEKDGYFRIATTDSENWSSETNTNNLYVLNENLEIIGKVEGLAKGEKIYSVRFIGKMGYMVTFKEIDPLFVIDLSDPTNPQVKGELKIPGYSSYLHPYDENHIIGTCAN